MMDYSGYDKEIAIEYTRKIDKHNGYTDFMFFVRSIVETGEIPNIDHPSVDAAKYVLNHFNKKGIKPTKENYQKLSLHLSGVEAAKATFPLNSDASFDEIAELSESVLEETEEKLKPWENEFMKRVWEKKKGWNLTV